jgi:hypothetical protein
MPLIRRGLVDRHIDCEVCLRLQLLQGIDFGRQAVEVGHDAALF